MNKRSMRLLIALGFILSVRAQSLDDVIRSTAKVSGLWRADYAEPQSPRKSSITGVVMDVQAEVVQTPDGPYASVSNVRLEFDSDPNFVRSRLYFDNRNGILGTDRVDVSRSDPGNEVRFSAAFEPQSETYRATLIWKGTSTNLSLKRLSVPDDASYEGDWIRKMTTDIEVFHVRQSPSHRMLVSYDRISDERADLGILWDDAQLKADKLSLYLYPPANGFHAADVKLSSDHNILVAAWRGPKDLPAEVVYHRLSLDAYPPAAPQLTVDQKPQPKSRRRRASLAGPPAASIRSYPARPVL